MLLWRLRSSDVRCRTTAMHLKLSSKKSYTLEGAQKNHEGASISTKRWPKNCPNPLPPNEFGPVVEILMYTCLHMTQRGKGEGKYS